MSEKIREALREVELEISETEQQVKKLCQRLPLCRETADHLRLLLGDEVKGKAKDVARPAHVRAAYLPAAARPKKVPVQVKSARGGKLPAPETLTATDAALDMVGEFTVKKLKLCAKLPQDEKALSTILSRLKCQGRIQRVRCGVYVVPGNKPKVERAAGLVKAAIAAVTPFVGPGDAAHGGTQKLGEMPVLTKASALAMVGEVKVKKSPPPPPVDRSLPHPDCTCGKPQNRKGQHKRGCKLRAPVAAPQGPADLDRVARGLDGFTVLELMAAASLGRTQCDRYVKERLAAGELHQSGLRPTKPTPQKEYRWGPAPVVVAPASESRNHLPPPFASPAAVRAGNGLSGAFTMTDLANRVPGEMTMAAAMATSGQWLARWKERGWIETASFGQYRRTEKFPKE